MKPDAVLRAALWTALLCSFAAPAFATPSGITLTADEAHSLLSSKGYTGIHDMELEHGVWEADAISPAGNPVDVRLDARNGRVLSDASAQMLTAAQVQQRLKKAGFKRVRDLELDDGVWTADARNAKGIRVELTIDPVSGKVLHEQDDRFD